MAIFIFSCSVSDDSSPQFYNEFLPIESTTLPEQFRLGDTYDITLTYIRPSTCYAFNNIYNKEQGNEITLAVVANVAYQTDNCETVNEEMETSFNFTANHNGSYVFKLWQGENTYLIVEVPVVE
ncbi:hypothetical protein OS188_12815 [Xanthomarina sp. F1114]|uniref:hypothetical protein n=1 Tax=Xanthomarina sp. F1114 TaxID=2996019 RepID=UPI00225E69D6|nr:hypothetical protein [Xanthomarina sp. F1114]MCX7548836.1 hypothetical protein [Xanthomarina sp. F1114]